MADVIAAVAPAPVVAAGATVAATAPAGTVVAPPIPGAVKTDAATPSGLPSLLDPIKPPDAVKTEPAKEPAKVEPVKHDYSKLEMPKDSLLPATHKEKIAAFASEHSLSPEVAQKLMAQQSADVKEWAASQVKAYDGVKQGWADALKAHPKYGGERLAETNKGATEVLNRFASPALLKQLQESGFGYKVEVIEFLDNIYQTMKPDKMVAPGAKTGGGLDQSDQARAKRLFPNSNHV